MMPVNHALNRLNNRVFRQISRPEPATLMPFQDLGVADVLEGLPPTALLDTGLRPIWPGAQIIGPALTVLNVSGDTLMLHYAVEICQPGDVLVLTSDEPSPSALWGKMVTVVAQARGVAGVIVDGFVRDTAYIREACFPVWARAISPRGSTRKGPGSVNVPVVCGGATINPGDLIMADDDGIIAIPPALAHTALAAGQGRVARELGIMPRLKEGISPYTLLGMEKGFQASGIEQNEGLFTDSN